MNAWLHRWIGFAYAVTSADSSGLLRRLGVSPVFAADAARELGLDAHATGLVLAILDAHGLVVEHTGRYVASDMLRAALETELREPGGIERLWGKTEDFLRTGKTPIHGTGGTHLAAMYTQGTPLLGKRFGPAAHQLATVLAPMLGDAKEPRLLDVGAGSGVWSLASLSLLGRGSATALDLPGVLPRFLERAAAFGLTERVQTIPGDFNTAELPRSSFDAVILGNVLHLENAERARALVGRAASAVAPNGVLVIVDMIADGSVEQRVSDSTYALHLALRIPESRVHPDADLRSWLGAAGFDSVQRAVLEPSLPGLAALVARRAAPERAPRDA